MCFLRFVAFLFQWLHIVLVFLIFELSFEIFLEIESLSLQDLRQQNFIHDSSIDGAIVESKTILISANHLISD